MDLYITIGKGQIENQNGYKNSAEIIVDLKEMWKTIINRFTHIHLDVIVFLPVMEKGQIKMELAKDVEINKIANQEVLFLVTYGDEDDLSKQPYGEAYLRGYQQISLGSKVES